MYIIDQDHVSKIDQRYFVLELDTIIDPDTARSKTYYCVIETMPLNEMQSAHIAADSHRHLIQAYQRQDWQFCLSAAKGLKGRWNGEIDSFYDILLSRIDRILVAQENVFE
jgi:hypothetical protein